MIRAVFGIDAGSGHIGLATYGYGPARRGPDYLWLKTVDTRDEVPSLSFLLKTSVCLTADEMLVAIEDIKKVYPRARFGTSMATSIAKTSDVVGALEERYKSQGLRVVRIEAAEWRQKIIGKKNPDNKTIKWVLESRLKTKLPRCTNHARDALGVAVYAFERERIEALTRRP